MFRNYYLESQTRNEQLLIVVPRWHIFRQQFSIHWNNWYGVVCILNLKFIWNYHLIKLLFRLFFSCQILASQPNLSKQFDNDFFECFEFNKRSYFSCFTWKNNIKYSNFVPGTTCMILTLSTQWLQHRRRISYCHFWFRKFTPVERLPSWLFDPTCK